MLEAELLIDRRAVEIRRFLLAGLHDPIARRKLEQLTLYKPTEFLQQTESVENRLMRWVSSGVLHRSMRIGTNALDFRAMMDDGKFLLVNLGLSDFVSEQDQRLIGSLLLNEFFETAMRRETGAQPFYVYLDAGLPLVSPELASTLEECRKRSLYLFSYRVPPCSSSYE